MKAHMIAGWRRYRRGGEGRKWGRIGAVAGEHSDRIAESGRNSEQEAKQQITGIAR